jgi:mono/diheme cytochrome c family protein
LTEIPEHLLRRSRERRAALGLSGGGEGEEAAPAGVSPAPPGATTGGGGGQPPRAPSTNVAVAGGAGTVAVVAPEAAEAPSYIAPPKGPHKTKIPLWVMPVLVAIPLWAFLFPGAFGNHQKATVSTDPLVIGNQVYHSAGCSGCHGANGEGGVGPALHGGQAVLTFPNVADQISWVKTGSAPFAGKKYGSPTRPGGQHGPATGGMPAFGTTLSEAQIEAVVTYERTKL